MTDNASKNGLANLLKGVGRSITSLIGIVTAVVVAYRLFQDNRGLVTTILLTLGLGILWLSSFYMYRESRKGAVYSLWIRRLALVGIIAVPILTATGYAVWKYYDSLPSDKIVLLVANFDGPEQYGVTDEVLNKLRKALEAYNDVKVDALGRAITEAEGSDVARDEGKKRKATIVLWGWYRVTPVKVSLSVHFEVLQSPKFMPGLDPLATGKPQRLAATDLDSFTIQTQLSTEMAYLSLFTIGMVRYAADDWDGAITRFTHALKQTAEGVPALDQSIIYRKRGVAWVAKGDYTRAIADYDQAIKLKPADSVAYTSRGAAYYIKGDPDRAIADFDRAIQLKPNDYLPYYDRGLAHRAKGNLELAIVDFDRAIQLKPDDPFPYLYRGLAYHAKGDYERAIADYSQAIRLKPYYATYYEGGFDYASAYHDRGLAYSAKGDYERAIADFDQAIKLKPGYADAYNGRGDAYNKKRDLDQAIADFSRAIDLDPKSGLGYHNRGVVHSDKGNLDQAIADYTKAIDLDPKDAYAYNNRSNAYRKKGNLDQALTDLNKAIELNPKYGTAYLHRGIAYFDKGKLDQAIADYTKAIELDPKDDFAYNNRGNAYREKGKFDQALTDLNKATELNPELDAAYENRGLVYRQQGLKSQAIAEFGTYLRLSPNASDRAHVQQWLRELKGQ